MKNKLNSFRDFCHTASLKTYFGVTGALHTHFTLILFLTGFGILNVGLIQVSSADVSDFIPDLGASATLFAPGFLFRDIKIELAICQLFRLIEGAFGGLVMTTAGIGAVIAAAFGAYRLGYGLIATGVGAFILRSLISLFFGTFSCGDIIVCGEVNVGPAAFGDCWEVAGPGDLPISNN